MPAAAITDVLNAAWFWSASEIEIDPAAFRVGLVASSVTSTTVGPITAASLVPWMVNELLLGAVERGHLLKVSTLVLAGLEELDVRASGTCRCSAPARPGRRPRMMTSTGSRSSGRRRRIPDR